MEVDFAISKALHLRFAHGNSDVAANFIRQRLVGRAAEEFETTVFAQVASPLALASRFGFLRFRTSLRLHGLFHPSIAGGDRDAFLLLVFRLYRYCSHFHLRGTSKLVGFGCIPASYCKLWLGD